MATITFYNSAKKKIGDADIDILVDTIKVALVTSSYTPNIDTHDFWDDVVANESSGSGYTAGGATLGSKTDTVNTSLDAAVVDGADVSWTITTSLTARYGIIYKSTGVDSTSALIAYIDFGSNQTAAGTNFVITWNASGIWKLA